jgi:hypothetical protein
LSLVLAQMANGSAEPGDMHNAQVNERLSEEEEQVYFTK